MTMVAIVQAACTKKVKMMEIQDNQKASKHQSMLIMMQRSG